MINTCLFHDDFMIIRNSDGSWAFTRFFLVEAGDMVRMLLLWLDPPSETKSTVCSLTSFRRKETQMKPIHQKNTGEKNDSSHTVLFHLLFPLEAMLQSENHKNENNFYCFWWLWFFSTSCIVGGLVLADWSVFTMRRKSLDFLDY